MEMFTKASGKMIKLMATESICTQMAHNMRATGKKINNTEKEKKRGLMVLATKATM